MSPVLKPRSARRLRHRQYGENYEPCEYEDGSRFKWIWIESVPPSQAKVALWQCTRHINGDVRDCPYPARMCRPKLEIETV